VTLLLDTHAVLWFWWADPQLTTRHHLPIEPIAVRLPSQVLYLQMERDGHQLRAFDPATGCRLLSRLDALVAA
jgi:hypothetical protein